jgi:hypothetical protein
MFRNNPPFGVRSGSSTGQMSTEALRHVAADDVLGSSATAMPSAGATRAAGGAPGRISQVRKQFGRSTVPTVAAPHQRTLARRPLPVQRRTPAAAAVSVRQCPQVGHRPSGQRRHVALFREHRRHWTLPQPSSRPHADMAVTALDPAADRPATPTLPWTLPPSAHPLRYSQPGMPEATRSVRLRWSTWPGRRGRGGHQRPTGAGTGRAFRTPVSAAPCRGHCGSRPGRTAHSRQCPPRSLPNGSVRPWAVLSGRQRSHLRLRAPMPQPWLSGDHATDAAGNIVPGDG